MTKNLAFYLLIIIMKSVMILSGGMDSTTLLYKLISEGKEVYAISFNYNQKHKIELEKAKATCEKLGINHKIIKIDFLNDITENSLTRTDIKVPEGHYEDITMKQTVVYNRNPIMFNIALSYALTIGAKEISLGIHSGDHFIYEDCRPEALEALQKTADIWEKGIKVYAPYLYGNKGSIIKDGIELGVDYTLTHTCYNPKGDNIGLDYRDVFSCGKCGSCQERLEAFKVNRIEDPILYKN